MLSNGQLAVGPTSLVAFFQSSFHMSIRKNVLCMITQTNRPDHKPTSGRKRDTVKEKKLFRPKHQSPNNSLKCFAHLRCPFCWQTSGTPQWEGLWSSSPPSCTRPQYSASLLPSQCRLWHPTDTGTQINSSKKKNDNTHAYTFLTAKASPRWKKAYSNMTSATLLTISLEENKNKEYIKNTIGSYNSQNLTPKDSILIRFHTWFVVEETDPSRLVH